MKMLFFVMFPTFLLHNLANANTQQHHVNHPTGADGSTGVRLPLIHRNKLLAGISSSSSNNDDDDYVHPRRRLASDFGMDVQNGFNEYFVTLGVGDPPTDQTLLMDTGSDLTWIQCQTCIKCFQQPHPIFDPSKSGSLSWVRCDSDTCLYYLSEDEKLDCNENQCGYKYGYADKTYTKGSIASETLTIGGTTTIIHNVYMGCANDNNISFYKNIADGLLGLGWGSLSLVSQSGGQIGAAFRFCLSSNESSDGWLTFGRSGFPREATEWARLIKNHKYPSFYYMDVLRVEVDGAPVENIAFQIDPKTGEGGVILDTGTTVTRLPEVAYNALRDKVTAQLDKLFTPTTTSIDPLLDTCYRLGSGVVLDKALLPRVSFIFQDMYSSTSVVQLNTTNVLLMRDWDANIACFAFARTSEMNVGSVIGNQQLQGIPITIDASAGYVGFGTSNAC